MLTAEIHQQGLAAARKATEGYLAKYGDGYPCGFAWVTAHVKGNTKLGKRYIAQGFTKAYGGGYQFWNPSGHHTQNVDAKDAGAAAYVQVIREAGVGGADRVYSNSRLD